MRRVALVSLTLLAAGLSGFGLWLLRLPAPAPAAEAPPLPAGEAEAVLRDLKPERQRPLVAVVGINDATETTDYLVSAGILRRAGVADVVLLAAGAGPVKLYPTLTVAPDATVAAFDARYPRGADYVIVPAMSRDDDPTVLAWLRQQAGKGAVVIGVCTGAKVVAAAGLLDGRRATTHWFYRKELIERHPSVTFVPDRRFVVDRGVATTTGITASVPAMLTLIEAISGRTRAEAVARDLGHPAWDARHRSEAFTFTRPFASTVLVNVLSFWNREVIGVSLRNGDDEVSLALLADAWSRTYRSRVRTHATSGVIRTRSGMRILPDEVTTTPDADVLIRTDGQRTPVETLDETLRQLASRYGERTAAAVVMQLEYPARGASR